jgi:carbamoyl-phosphate synthase large subunit
MGENLKNLVSTLGYQQEPPFYTVKAPVFSHTKLPGLDPKLEAEMKSTGELIAISDNLDEAFRKAFVWGEREIPLFFKKKGSFYCEVGEAEKAQFSLLKDKLERLDYQVIEDDRSISFQEWLNDDNCVGYLSVNINDERAKKRRMEALNNRLPVITELSTFTQMVKALKQTDYTVKPIDQWLLDYENAKKSKK